MVHQKLGFTDTDLTENFNLADNIATTDVFTSRFAAWSYRGSNGWGGGGGWDILVLLGHLLIFR